VQRAADVRALRRAIRAFRPRPIRCDARPPGRSSSRSPRSRSCTRHRRAARIWAAPEVQQFVEELAATHGFDRARLERWLRDARYSASVERLMQPPIPFGQRNWLEYRQRYLDPARVQAEWTSGRRHRVALARAEEQFGVPAEIIVAVIGVETYFGASPATSVRLMSSRR